MREYESLEVRPRFGVKRVAAYLVSSARALRTMQLTSGELPAVEWSASGEAYYAPAPLLSALAYDALAFVDPRSPMFVPRVRDLVPAAFFGEIVTLRWGLRLSLASEQNSDGTWHLHGRLGKGNADVATTACAAAAMLPNVKWRRATADKRHHAVLQRMHDGNWTTLESAHALRYFALLGVDTQPLLARIRKDVAQPSLDAATTHAITSALRLLPDAALEMSAPPATRIGSLAGALRTAALLDRNDEGGEVDEAIGRLLLDDTPPWRWPADPYGEHRIASPAVALAMQIANVARRAALPRGESA